MENICTKINVANIFLCQTISSSCISDWIPFYMRKWNEKVNYVIHSVSVRLHLMHIFSDLVFPPAVKTGRNICKAKRELHTKNGWIVGACRSNAHCLPLPSSIRTYAAHPSASDEWTLLALISSLVPPNYYFDRNEGGGY